MCGKSVVTGKGGDESLDNEPLRPEDCSLARELSARTEGGGELYKRNVDDAQQQMKSASAGGVLVSLAIGARSS